ncbi:GntR family transcriptional regulator [Paenibacillus sp.]|uniref:FadR/GntR family transcriptional regulator n=1 Tax=Paenibacillus sp. TaxID=58172 RepID=UPI00281205E2|nr:GntR family transcriptional regulator [Paenibacillus sp.]
MKPIEKSERYTLSQLVVQNLKQLILERKMAPGDKLPAERELSQILGVSRAILREALRSLESFGILEIKHGEGTYVAGNFLNPLVEQLAFVLQMNEKTFQELHEVRFLLEAAALASVPTPNPELWDELQELSDQFAGPALDLEERAAIDARFHLAVIGSLQNQTLLYLAKPFVQQLSVRLLTEADIQKSAEEHTSYLNAIRTGDMALAKTILQEHLSTKNSNRHR